MWDFPFWIPLRFHQSQFIFLFNKLHGLFDLKTSKFLSKLLHMWKIVFHITFSLNHKFFRNKVNQVIYIVRCGQMLIYVVRYCHIYHQMMIYLISSDNDIFDKLSKFIISSCIVHINWLVTLNQVEYCSKQIWRSTHNSFQ